MRGQLRKVTTGCAAIISPEQASIIKEYLTIQEGVVTKGEGGKASNSTE